MRGRIAVIAGAILLAVVGQHAHAVITAKTPLSAIESAAAYVIVGKVVEYSPEKLQMSVKAIEDIKGKAPFRNLPINCKIADEKIAKDNQIGPLLKRFGPDMEIIFFVAPVRGKSHITFAYTNGTWFQLLGTKTGDNEIVFTLKSAEPYFRKSFKGTTAELRQLLKDHAAGKVKLPPLDEKVEPGFGPEYEPKKTADRRPLLDVWIALNGSAAHGSQGPLFGVIPTIGLGAPLAILALLFPSLFGGVFQLFRQWMAFITLISINSTLLLLQWYLATWNGSLLRGTGLGDGSAAWLMMTISTFACAFWAWRRQLNAMADGEREAPQRTELAVLAFMSAGCVLTMIGLWGFTVMYLQKPILWSDVGWTMTVVLTLSIIAGGLYRVWSAAAKPVPFGSVPLPTEGVILCAMLFGHVAFVPAIWGSNVSTAGDLGGKEKAADPTKPVEKVLFTADVKAMFASTPLVDGDWIYASYSEMTLRAATLVKINRKTGAKKWEFLGKNDDLVQMISTPCIADGKLYFGEGFHDDKNCKVYCVDAEKGTEDWRFVTAGQTESSPAVADGKVYIGAGNVGVYCLDAKTGKELWKYPPANYRGRLLRFGGGMRVVGKRVYCGTGVDRNEKDDKGKPAVLCLDADNGKLVWEVEAPYPVWSTPILKDDFVFVTTGNGDLAEDAQPPDKPGGALLCLEAKTGKEIWRTKVENGIIDSPAIDGHRIYFGCRDGHIYCMNRADGKERWKHFLESPIIATPVLDTDASAERTFSVFVTATAGKVCCLNPQNGDIVWTFNLTGRQAYITASPRLVVTRTPDGFRRQLLFGCGIGGGPRDSTANRPAFYAIEDGY
jgi:outer membrane protein assembly factor BamB